MGTTMNYNDLTAEEIYDDFRLHGDADFAKATRIRDKYGLLEATQWLLAQIALEYDIDDRDPRYEDLWEIVDAGLD